MYQERVFVEDIVMTDQFGRVREEVIVVDDVYYGNGRVQETVVVEDRYYGGGGYGGYAGGGIYGEQVYVGQAAMTAAPVYGVNPYSNNSGMGGTYYSNNNTALLIEE